MIQAPRAGLRLSRKSLQRQLSRFLRSLRSKGPETRGTYERALREFLRWFARDANFCFREPDVVRYRAYLKRRRLSRVSVSTYLTALRRFCEFLVTKNLLAVNPARHVGGNSRPTGHSRDALTEAEVQTLLSAVQPDDDRGIRDAIILRLMVEAGLSEIEITRADVGDLTPREGGSALLVQGKGRRVKDAAVTISQELQQLIERYLSNRSHIAPDDPLIVSAGNRTRGMRMTTRGIRDRVNFHLRLSGIRHDDGRVITPYSLRHTAGVLLAGRGASTEEIRKRMRLGSDQTALLYLRQGQAHIEP